MSKDNPRGRRTPVWTLPLFSLLLILPAVARPAAAERPVDQHVQAPRDGVVDISNLAGSVDIEGWDRAEVAVTGTLGDRVEKLVLENQGSRTRLEVRVEHGSQDDDSGREWEARLQVKVPAASRVEASTVSADLHTDGVRGRLELKTVSGEITIAGSPQEVEAESVSGDVTSTVSAARVELKTVSGKVEVEGAVPEVEARSVSGDVDVRATGVTRLSAGAVSGDVRFDGELSAGGDLSAQSHSGNVELVLPAAIAADFEIETFSGSIDSDFGPAPERRSRYAPGETLRFSTGSGGSRIEAQSFSGEVHVRRR